MNDTDLFSISSEMSFKYFTYATPNVVLRDFDETTLKSCM